MKKKLLILYLLLAKSIAFSQNNQVIPPSPTSSALGKYVDNPVSLYTGTPQITIPLYDLKVKDYTLPINLSYHAGGIKVEETASNIGLGWVLNAGGVITRVVKDVPDDYTAPTCNSAPTIEPDCRDGILKHGKNIHDIDILGAYNQDANDNRYSAENIFARFFSISNDGLSLIFEKLDDSEPDVFYFNFCGKSGKFVFEVINGQEKIKLLSHEDLKITHTFGSDGRLSKFQVVDALGVIYLFEDIEVTESLVKSQSPYPVSFNTGFSGISFSTFPIGYSETRFNSSWNLTKIITTTGNEINFTYQDEVISYLNNGSEQTGHSSLSLNYDPNVRIPNTVSFHNLIISNRTNSYAKRLSNIETKDAKINFNSDLLRQDVWGHDASKFPKLINGLTIYSKQLENLNQIKKLVFSQDYFESPAVSGIEIGDLYYLYSNNTALNIIERHMDVYLKRLRLRSVTEIGSSDTSINPPTVFEYKYEGFAGYSERLPHRFSRQQDLWGLYNGVETNTTLIPKLYVYPDMYTDSRRFSVYRRTNFTGREYILAGGNRLPSQSLMDVGTLTKIIYPTGGYTKYEYEPHKFNDGNDEFTGGGLRIKKIIKHDAINTARDVIYNYSYMKADNTASGEIISMPIFAVSDGQGSQHPLDNSNNSYILNTTRFSQPQAPLGTTQGSNIGYRMVTESIIGNGRTTYEYSMPALWHNSNDLSFPNPQADCSISNNGSCNSLYKATTVYDLFPFTSLRSSYFNQSMNRTTINSFPFPENPNYDWNRGQLLVKKDYNEVGKLVREENNSYSVKYFNGQTSPGKVYGIKFGTYYPAYFPNTTTYNSLNCYRVAKYNYLTDVAKVLSSKSIKEYYEDGSFISSLTEYKYEGISHNNITKIIEETSTLDKETKTLKYEPDYTGPPVYPQEGIYALRNKQISAIPIEETDYILKNGIEILKRSILNTYSLTNNSALPDKSFKLESSLPLSDFQPSTINGPGFFIKDSRYVEKLKYKRYDAVGNLLEVDDKVTGLTTSYIWGYNNIYPIAKVINASYDDIIAALSVSNLSTLNRGYKVVTLSPGPPEPILKNVVLTDLEIRTMLSTLRSSLPNAMITTYTYKPLIGISSITDPKGDTITYTYDAFGRLEFVKDKDGNILTENQYKYKQ